MTRILVVDDDPDMRALVGHHLARAGYEVQLAEGAAAARERIAERLPDLIVADIDMPGTTGDELASSLREDASLPRIPLVYLTGMPADSALAQKTLGYPLLAKPLVPGDLLAMVARQLPHLPGVPALN